MGAGRLGEVLVKSEKAWLSYGTFTTATQVTKYIRLGHLGSGLSMSCLSTLVAVTAAFFLRQF